MNFNFQSILVIGPCSYPQSYSTTNLFSVSVGLPFLVISCKWNHARDSLLCFTSFSLHNALQVHPYSRMSPVVHFFFNCWILFYIMDVPHFVYLFTSWWAFGLFTVIGFYENAVMNICLHVFVWTYTLISLR